LFKIVLYFPSKKIVAVLAGLWNETLKWLWSF